MPRQVPRAVREIIGNNCRRRQRGDAGNVRRFQGERHPADQASRGALGAAEAAWPAARTNFTGEAWAASWADWEPRLKQLKKKIEVPTKVLGAPSQKP